MDRRIGSQVPARGPRLRRLLLPQGHARARRRSRATAGVPSRHRRRDDRGQRAPDGAHGRQDRARPSGAPRGKRGRRARALVQAQHRRPARGAGARRSSPASSARGVKVRAFDPVAMPHARPLPAMRRTSTFADDAYDARARRRRAGDRHRVERVPRTWTCARLKRAACASRCCATCATSTTPARSRRRACAHVGVGRGRAADGGRARSGTAGGCSMIEGVMVKPLKVIPDERGCLMEMLRDDDAFFQTFGQVYLLGGLPGRGQGLALPQEADRPLRVRQGHGQGRALRQPRGQRRRKGEVNEFFMGEQNPILLVIPPRRAARHEGHRHRAGLPGQHADRALRLRRARRVPRRRRTTASIPYDWSRKDG